MQSRAGDEAGSGDANNSSRTQRRKDGEERCGHAAREARGWDGRESWGERPERAGSPGPGQGKCAAALLQRGPASIGPLGFWARREGRRGQRKATSQAWRAPLAGRGLPDCLQRPTGLLETGPSYEKSCPRTPLRPRNRVLRIFIVGFQYNTITGHGLDTLHSRQCQSTAGSRARLDMDMDGNENEGWHPLPHAGCTMPAAKHCDNHRGRCDNCRQQYVAHRQFDSFSRARRQSTSVCAKVGTENQGRPIAAEHRSSHVKGAAR